MEATGKGDLGRAPLALARILCLLLPSILFAAGPLLDDPTAFSEPYFSNLVNNIKAKCHDMRLVQYRNTLKAAPSIYLTLIKQIYFEKV